MEDGIPAAKQCLPTESFPRRKERQIPTPMKTLSLLGRSAQAQLTKAPALFAITAALAAGLWLVTGGSSLATPNVCMVCHKNTTTLTFACNSLEYQRHLDHGDPANACAMSSTDQAQRAESR